VAEQVNTPEEQNDPAIEAAQRTLMELTGGPDGAYARKLAARDTEPAPGRTTSTTGAARLAAREGGMTQNQQAIAKLNAKDSDLWSSDEVKQKAAVAKLRMHLAAESTEEEQQAIADAPLADLRNQYKIDATKVLAPIRDRWDSEEEARMLATFSLQGTPPAAVNEIVGWCQGVFNGALGLVGNIDAEAVEAEFRALATKHGINRRGERDRRASQVAFGSEVMPA
jgi:hypothetical protein